MKLEIEKEAALQSLLIYLQEEFQGYPAVRCRIRQLATTQKSPDLEQDYDPEVNDLHRERGVIVRASSREYFFPLSWANGRNRSAVDQNVREIKDFLDGSP